MLLQDYPDQRERSLTCYNLTMSAPFFSVVIPTLNEEKALPHLLKDLQQQTWADFSVTVVDGKSQDKTPSIVKKIGEKDDRFALLISERRHVGAQRNLGAKQSKGPYLLFLDADDRIPKFFLEGLHYQLMKKDVDTFTCWSISETSNANDVILMKIVNLVFEAGKKLDRPLMFGACIGCKRTVFSSLHGFSEKLGFMEDIQFARKAVHAGYSLEVFKEPTVMYSLRRLRKEGTLKIIHEQLPIWIKMLKSKHISNTVGEYPMLGGTYFDQDDSRQKKTYSLAFLREMEESMKRIIKSRSGKIQASIRDFLEEIV